MARTVQPNDMMSRLETMTHTENDPNLTPKMKWEFLSQALSDVWDKIIKYSGGTHFVKPKTFNTVANQAEYVLETVVTDGDFYRVSQLYTDEGGGQFRPIGYVHPAELHPYKPVPSVVPMKLYYTPCAPVWDGTGDVAFDGVNGWEELVLVIAAQAVMARKQDSGSAFAKRQRELEARLADMAVRTDAQPDHVVRRAARYRNTMYFPWRNNVSAYTLRGRNLELYYKDGVVI